MEVSIIVPNYNGSEYIYRCLDSLRDQETDILYEVIIIDNNSSDASLDIIKKFCAENNNFKFFVAEQKGVSFVRNIGIEKAKGKFITFVDSDDIISNRYIKDLVFDDKKFLMSCSLYTSSEDEFDKIKDMKKSKVKSFPMTEFVDNIFDFDFYIKPGVWAKMFLAETIRKNSLKFSNDIEIGEDFLFLTQYIYHSNDTENIQITFNKNYFKNKVVIYIS